MIRKADLRDPEAIRDLVNDFAARGLMLPRALNEIYENLRDFFVCEEDGQVVGCVALHVSWQGLGEIRSLAVVDHVQGRGVGKSLVGAALEEAREMGMNRVFALTYAPGFFRPLGFLDYPKEELPHKIWTDCLKCPKFPNCDEVAVVIDLAEST